MAVELAYGREKKANVERLLLFRRWSCSVKPFLFITYRRLFTRIRIPVRDSRPFFTDGLVPLSPFAGENYLKPGEHDRFRYDACPL